MFQRRPSACPPARSALQRCPAAHPSFRTLLARSYTEFSVEGAASIHLTGYYMPEYQMGAF